jgi:hypothetical protein
MMSLFWGIAVYIAFVFLLDLFVEVIAGVFSWAARHEARIRADRLAV